MDMNDRSKRFLTVLRRGNKDERLGLLQEMPLSPMRDAASSFLGSEKPEMQVMALNTLVTSYGFGQAAELAGDLARAAYPFAREILDHQRPGGPLLLLTVSAIASSGLHAFNLIGRYSESVAFANEVIPDLESLAEDTNLPDIYAHKIEALIGLHRLDDASERLEEAEKYQQHSVHLPRLKKELEKLRQRATDLRSDQSGEAQSMSPEAFRALSDVLDQGKRILTRSSEEMNEWQAHTIHRRVGQLLQDEIKGRDPSLLAKALKELNQVESWARKSGHSDVHNDTLWEMYICHFRMETWAEAADALQGLRRNVEKRRAGIDDRLKRAGVGAKFPYLYPALCQTLLKAGRIEELLGAIEGAKGRAVADVMAQRSQQVIDEAEFTEPAAHMGELMSRSKAHYLSFLVDDDDTLAVLVGKDGSLHASRPIPLGKDRIRSAGEYVDPKLWGKRHLADLTGPRIQDMAEVLEPLVAWLDPHFRSGLIENGDHVCYSPDEHLHQFPLAYVRFRGEPLVRRVSISRTHGARALALILGRRVSRPRMFLSVEVPARQDLENEAMVRNLRAPSTWLARHLSGATCRDQKATLESLRKADLTERVVHFATHGVFPVEDDQNPFTHSGLALAGVDGLPDKDRLVRGEGHAKLLTPERVLAAQSESFAVKKGLDFTGSHVTLQGCVTGLAREGIGGDALGLDWALFQQGASSLLASHWNVSAELSTEFFLRFYRSWVEGENSRATAWRQTILGMMGEQGALSDPYAWAAFSLSGDWR